MNAKTAKTLSRYARQLAAMTGYPWKPILRGFKAEWKHMPPRQREMDLRKMREGMR